MHHDPQGIETAIAKALFHDRTHPLPEFQECACVCPECFTTQETESRTDCICPECPCHEYDVPLHPT